MKFTVFNLEKSLHYIKEGEKITFKKVPHTLDDKQIIAYYNGEEIGRVANGFFYIVPGSELGKNVYETLEAEFEGTVVNNRARIISSKTIVRVMECLVVEI